MITCPVCGLRMKRLARTHLRKHNLTGPEFQSLRIESEHGVPVAEFLRKIYFEEEMATPEIFRRYGLTYRALRELLTMHQIPMRDRGDAVRSTWSKDDGSRAQMTSELMKKTMDRFDLSGENNPTKRMDVRKKISQAKLRSNPGLMPMLEALSLQRLAQPTPIEQSMQEALDGAGFAYEREYQVGRYFIDFALTSIKIAVECDGGFWHTVRPGHDAKRDAWLKTQGWRVFRYTGEQINTGVHACVQDLIARLNELGIDPPATQ